MSQTVEEPRRQSSDPEFQQFDYRPVPVLAPISLISGVLAISVLLSVFGLAVAVFGLLMGLIGLRKIQKGRGEYGGGKVAWAGICVSTVFLIGGSLFHSYVYATEVPEGYARIDFYSAISKKGYQIIEGQFRPHQDVQALDGKKVFLKGYMYPTKQLEGIQNFVLVKDNQACCFGGQPEMTDMIEVFLQNGKTAKDYRGLTSVAGTFRVSNASGRSSLSPLYSIEAINAGPAKTSF